MNIDQLFECLNADEKGRIFSKLKEHKKQINENKPSITQLEFVTKTILYLVGENKKQLKDKYGMIDLMGLGDITLIESLDGYHFENKINVMLEESFNVHQFLRIIYYFKNRGFEFSNVEGTGFRFIKIYDRDWN